MTMTTSLVLMFWCRSKSLKTAIPRKGHEEFPTPHMHQYFMCIDNDIFVSFAIHFVRKRIAQPTNVFVCIFSPHLVKGCMITLRTFDLCTSGCQTGRCRASIVFDASHFQSYCATFNSWNQTYGL